MNKIYESLRTTVVFKHFSRKNYSLFAALGKVVLIGVLSVSTLTYAKANSIAIHDELATDTIVNAEVGLDEVVITGAAVPLSLADTPQMVTVISQETLAQHASTPTINDIFHTVAAIDVRQRGPLSVQSDISLRGGNFDQIAFLLNGIPFSSPHTGHLSADFPLSPDDIARIEVLPGGASRVYGAGPLNGVINLLTPRQGQFTTAHIAAGTHGTVSVNANTAFSIPHLHTFLSAGYTRSDGATTNSAFYQARCFATTTAQISSHTITGQFSFSYKPYDANTFYGTGSNNQWESNERLSAAITAQLNFHHLHLAPQLYWNRWFDHYQWEHHSPSGENYHRVSVLGGGLTAWVDSRLGKTALTAEAHREAIWSTSLGTQQEPIDYHRLGGIDKNDSLRYTHHYARTITSIALEHTAVIRRLSFTVGATATYTPLTHWTITPGINLAYHLKPEIKLFLSYNAGMRLPTFTDLFYSGVNIEGNDNLRAEYSHDVNAGIQYHHRGLTAQAELFVAKKRDMIDWVQYEEANDDIYHSQNFRLTNYGVDLSVNVDLQQFLTPTFPVEAVSVNYSFLHQTSHYPVTVISSKYAMDYVPHKLVIATTIHLVSRLHLNIDYRFVLRDNNELPRQSILDAKLEWKARHYAVYLSANNILNKQYYDYPAVPLPRFTALLGAKINI